MPLSQRLLCMFIKDWTVKRVVGSMGHHKRVPRRKSNSRPANKPLRVQWAQAHLSWTYEWKSVLWTDGSSISTACFGHRPWVIRLPDEEHHPDCIDEIFNQGRQSGMVWGAFVGASSLNLCSFLEKSLCQLFWIVIWLAYGAGAVRVDGSGRGGTRKNTWS